MRALRLLLAGVLALGLVGTAQANLAVRTIDTSDYPTIRLTVVTSSAGTSAPWVSEDGHHVSGLHARNVGRQKAIVLAIDRSRSMAGTPFADALASATTFVSLKRQQDQIALVTFGSQALVLTPLSQSTADASLALRSLAVSGTPGTALYDAVVTGSRLLAQTDVQARILILLTDGNDVSSSASKRAAIKAARAASVVIYPIGIQGNGFSAAPLRELASTTGGRYLDVSSTSLLQEAYGQIARELNRVWQLEYVTSARPGERPVLLVASAGETARVGYAVAGVGPSAPAPSRLVPSALYGGALGTVAVALLAGLLGLAAVFLVLSTPTSARLRRRLAPHLGEQPERASEDTSEDSGRLHFKPLLEATERAFSTFSFWSLLARQLRRADSQLTPAQLLWLSFSVGLFFGLVTTATGAPPLVGLLLLILTSLLPSALVTLKARRRVRTFDAQLPELLASASATLKAGHSFRVALQNAADESEDPARKEFQRALLESRLGRPLEDALTDLVDRLGSEDLDFVVTSVIVQNEVGGSLAGLFDQVGDTVRQRQQFARKVRGLTAMGRMSAYVLVALPFFLLGLMTMLNRGYISPLFTTSTGHKLIVLSLLMISVGALFLKRVVTIKG